MITTGNIQFINDIGNYDNTSFVIDLSKLNCDIKKDDDKIIISLKRKESEKALF